MAADYSRIHRLLKILTLIQGGSGWTPRRLALECNTTERTVYRDLKMLKAAGIPCSYDEERETYEVRRDFFMPPVQLTLDESLALVSLAEHIGGREQIPFTDAAARGIEKIRGQLPYKIRDELEKIESNVVIQLAAANPPEAAEDVYSAVRRAISRRCALRCEYESIASDANGSSRGGRKRGVFLFKPYALFFAQRAWYAVGLHEGRDEVRCLKLTRFTRIEPTDIPFRIPADFSLTAHLGNAWRMIRGRERYEVEIQFDPSFAETIADTHWHRTQEVVWNADGSILFTCTVDGLDEIVWWVLSMGPHCVVNKPTELVEEIRALAGRLYRLYPENGSPTVKKPPHRAARRKASGTSA